ncbi:tyrosine-type recombinase/integrase [Arcobacter sp. YIC-310]|uniref:tyrosine-type recombinase/integrase n=1 Tax=Arcobacter sp. YIC-310 TaxID=3376632 RepID=UPI003C149FE4
MAKTIVSLSDKKIKNAKPKDKDYKLFDGGGLFILITKAGGKSWRLKYRFDNREKLLTLGLYPHISLKEARELKDKYKSLIAKGIDPNKEKREKKIQNKMDEEKKENSFYKVSQEWHKNYATEVSENYHYKLERALENYIYPFLKNKPISDITRLDIIEILKDLKSKGIIETGNRVFMLLNKIFKYAVTLEYTQHNIIADIEVKNILGKPQKKHYPTFTKEKNIRGLLLAIDDYEGDYTTKMALKVLPYVFVRSYNIRHAEWSEISFKNKEWIIPANKMKAKKEFIIPLPQQVLEILNEVKKITGDNNYIFPSFRQKDRPMSENTLLSAIRRMGYTKEEFVPHSFRAMFSTIAYENMNIENGHNHSSEIIEALLAHEERNKVKEAYNRAKYKVPMRDLINWYANYLDNVKKS